MNSMDRRQRLWRRPRPFKKCDTIEIDIVSACVQHSSSHEASLNSISASCSSAVSGFPFPPLHAAVGVAVSSMSLATTVQLVPRQGMLGRRGYALESVAARICREARVGTNIMVRDVDLLPQDHQDGRRLEVVADGLPLFHGAQLAIDTTLVSPVGRDGLPHPERMEQPWQPREEGRRGLFQSSLGSSAELDSWCSQVRCAGDGLRRRRLF